MWAVSLVLDLAILLSWHCIVLCTISRGATTTTDLVAVDRVCFLLLFLLGVVDTKSSSILSPSLRLLFTPLDVTWWLNVVPCVKPRLGLTRYLRGRSIASASAICYEPSRGSLLLYYPLHRIVRYGMNGGYLLFCDFNHAQLL